MLRKINLQLFGEEEIEIDDVEIEDESIEVEPEEDDELEPKEPEEKKEEQPIPEDVVPKKALIAERKKFQKQIAELKKQMESTGEQPDVALETLVNEGGIDESVAKAIAKLVNKTSNKAESAESKVNRALREMEFERLKDKPEYSDIDEYREDIEELADKTGLSLKKCYHALLGEEKVKLYTQKINEIKDNQSKAEYKAINTVNNGSQSDMKTSKYKLTKDEQDIAKMSGMTPKEYYLMKYAKSATHLSKIYKKG